MPEPSSDARARLQTLYGGPLPPGLGALTAEQLARLADAVDDARARQKQALRGATDRGLDFVPTLLRGPVKKVLFG